MNLSGLKQKTERLLQLHHGDELLVLPNVWDPIGARILEAEGYPAVATASAAISSSLGYRDGEKIGRSTMLEAIARIAQSVDVPVSADIESGYAKNTEQLAETVSRVLNAGIAGINLEDSAGNDAKLIDISEQCERLAVVRETADAHGIHLLINARIDSFIHPANREPEAQLEDAIQRAEAYLHAGADCVFPIGPGDTDTVSELCKRLDGPVNILMTKNAAPLDELKRLGVRRVSFGPFVFRACYKQFVDIAQALRNEKNCAGVFENTLTQDEIRKYLRERFESND